MKSLGPSDFVPVPTKLVRFVLALNTTLQLPAIHDSFVLLNETCLAEAAYLQKVTGANQDFHFHKAEQSVHPEHHLPWKKMESVACLDMNEGPAIRIGAILERFPMRSGYFFRQVERDHTLQIPGSPEAC